ncbi:MAG: hypothetical protein FJW63_06705 [Actinobacteria bacterium]|nr:hypothetical protein [Actinomycetota bacterium]
MKDIAYSVNNIPIRLTGEWWTHIVENHEDMAGYYFDVLEAVNNSSYVLDGDEDELWTVKYINKVKVFLVIYKESKSKNDGFIVTAFTKQRLGNFLKGE